LAENQFLAENHFWRKINFWRKIIFGGKSFLAGNQFWRKINFRVNAALLPAGLTAAAGGGGAVVQPQVKIITPQGRMQMQQIQTPTGPKLITVPVGGGSVQVQIVIYAISGKWAW
jgi:hypothetical protein